MSNPMPPAHRHSADQLNYIPLSAKENLEVFRRLLGHTQCRVSEVLETGATRLNDKVLGFLKG